MKALIVGQTILEGARADMSNYLENIYLFPFLTEQNIKEYRLQTQGSRLVLKDTLYFRPSSHVEIPIRKMFDEARGYTTFYSVQQISQAISEVVTELQRKRVLVDKTDAMLMKGKWFALRGMISGLFDKAQEQMCYFVGKEQYATKVNSSDLTLGA